LIYREGTIITRGLKVNEFEETFGIPYERRRQLKDKVKDVMYVVYENCLVSEEQYELITPHYKKGLVWEGFEKKEYDNIIKVYSDGASYNNGKKNKDLPTYGSYGTVITINDELYEEAKYAEENWTNNIGELRGSLDGLTLAASKLNIDDPKATVIAVVDSQYVALGCVEYMSGWIMRGWKNNLKQPTPNKEIWQQMKKFIDSHNVRFKWLRGHTEMDGIDYHYNDRCDELANQALEEKFGIVRERK
jgi:ribonuclease HI